MKVPERIIRANNLVKITSLSKSTIWRLEKKGQFPSRRQISPNSVGWLESEILEWMESRKKLQIGGASTKLAQ